MIKMLHRIIKFQNHTVPIYAVYVVIGSNEMRKYLHSNKITCQNGDKYISYYDGMCGQVDEIVPDSVFFPNFFNYQDYSISRTKFSKNFNFVFFFFCKTLKIFNITWFNHLN